MKTTLLRCLLALGSLLVFFAMAEGLYRWLGPDEITASNLHAKYRLYFEDVNRKKTNHQREFERGNLLLARTEPRVRQVWAPNITFYLCYTGATQRYFDDRGCVPCVINSCQIREREELCGPKPEGQRRVVCIGDSFTFGWGVRVEDAWPRRVEDELRQADDAIRTVNCGASGAIYVDEYRIALEERFHRFDPDVVVVTLCLNDLIPSFTALSHQEAVPPEKMAFWRRHSRLLRALTASYALADQLAIDPERDLVQELFDLPEEAYQFIPWLSTPQTGLMVKRDALWPGGGPQKELLAMREWCRERGVTFGVVIWPYLQGLGPGEHYPFAKLHRLVESFCATNEIPFLDVLPALRGKRPTPELWVSPADYHANVVAQELAVPPITEFVAGLLRRD